MFEYSSMFTFQDMKYPIEYSHFQSFNTPNFDGSEKLKYFKRSWIRSHIILFGVYMFLKMGNTINYCFLLISIECLASVENYPFSCSEFFHCKNKDKSFICKENNYSF